MQERRKKLRIKREDLEENKLQMSFSDLTEKPVINPIENLTAANIIQEVTGKKLLGYFLLGLVCYLIPYAAIAVVAYLLFKGYCSGTLKKSLVIIGILAITFLGLSSIPYYFIPAALGFVVAYSLIRSGRKILSKTIAVVVIIFGFFIYLNL